MKIEILYVPGCPNCRLAADAVRSALTAESLEAEIRKVAVHTQSEAEALRFQGSPTIRVNGEDVEPEPGNLAGLACRLYSNGLGVPGEEAIRRAMFRAKREEQKCE